MGGQLEFALEPAKRLRLEVTDEHGSVAVIIQAETDPRVSELAAAAVAALAAVPGVASEAHAREILLSCLIRRYADEAAYERVAEQRGVLPL